MHHIEPFWSWRDLYCAENDENSPFFQKEYSEIYLSNTVYNYYIHPQWDDFGSETLYIKILFTDYNNGFAIIEFIGEWNDCLYNDIKFLKRNIVEQLTENGISKFILIGENVMNFHYSDDLYYQDWFEDLGQDGWILAIGFLPHVIDEFKKARINYYINFVEDSEILENWRTYNPVQLFRKINDSLE